MNDYYSGQRQAEAEETRFAERATAFHWEIREIPTEDGGSFPASVRVSDVTGNPVDSQGLPVGWLTVTA
jgi:hypothetical protein